MNLKDVMLGAVSHKRTDVVWIHLREGLRVVNIHSDGKQNSDYGGLREERRKTVFNGDRI